MAVMSVMRTWCNYERSPALPALIDLDAAAIRVERFFPAAVDLMKTMSRARGHDHLNKFDRDDIAS
jgi:hypothetical protein